MASRLSPSIVPRRQCDEPQLHREMLDLRTELRYEKETRVVIITGAGDNFCAGHDLKQYSLELEPWPARVRSEVGETVRRWRNEMLRTLPQPVIACITAPCLGGALTIVVGCDIANAADDAVLGLPPARFLGHLCDAIHSLRPSLAGARVGVAGA